MAEASARGGSDLSTRVRLGKPELVEEAGHHSISLRVIRAERVALTSTSERPRLVGTPLITPVVVLITRPGGSPVAPNVSGLPLGLLAVSARLALTPSVLA